MFVLRSARGRAILAGTVLVLLLVGLAALAVWRARHDEQSLATLDRTSSAATAIEGARAGFWQAQGALSALVISGDPAFVHDYDDGFAAAEQNLAKARAEFLAIGGADEVSALDALTNRIGQFNESVRPLFPVIIEGDRQAVVELANAKMPELTTTNTAIIAALEAMVREEQQEAAAGRAAAERDAEVTLWLLLGLSVAALATGIGIVIMFVSSVVGPLAALRASARAIASGSLMARARVSGPEEVASLARDFNDMTDALAAKTGALQESERRYRLLADNASDIIWTMDMSLQLTYESPSVTRIRGYTREEAMAQTMEETLTPASLEVATKALAEELALEKAEQRDLSRSRTLELEHFCKDGSTIWLEITTTFLRDEDGRPVGILGASRDISERKRTEDALRESEEKYRELVENINEIIYTLDSNGVITYISPVVEQLGGYTPSEVIGRPFTEFVHPDDISPLMRSFQETFAGNREAFEYRVLAKSGEAHWVRTSSRPVLEGDRIVGFHAVLTDITERKRAEEAVLRAKEEWERTFDAVPDLIAVIDEHYHIVRANRAMAERLGLRPEECVGKVCYEVVHGLDCPPEFCPHTPSLADGRNHTAEVNEPRLGGEFMVSVTPLADEQGRRVGSVHVARDITERKRAEEALRESEERFRRLTDASLEGIAINDKGEIVDANTAFARMFGREPSELIGMHASDLVAPGSRELVMQRALSGDEQPYEAVGLRKNGTTFWIEVCGKALPYSGRLLRVTAVRDISERKRAEEALRESEARYKALFAGAPEGMLVADLQTKQFRYANPAMCRMFGYTEEEFLRIGVPDIHPKESLDHVLAEFEAQARGEKLLSPGLPCLRKDGTLFYANISAITTVLDGRKCNVGIFSDVTEHKRAEEELRETRDYLEKLIDHANAPIIVWDPSFTITRFNDAFERLTGRPASDVLGQRLEVLFPEPERTASMEQIARTLRGEFWELIEIPILHQSGEVRQVLWNSANITGADGRTVVATIAQGTDISKRRRAEEALRESESKYRTLVENIPQKVFFKDRNSVYVSCNENYARDLNVNPDEIAGKTDHDFYPRELADKYRADDKRVIQSGETEDIEEEYVQDGRQAYVHTIKTPVRDESGSVVGVLGVFWDVSERKRAEEVLRESEERTRLIVETAHDAFISGDTSGAITAWNAQAEKTFGWAAAEAIGRRISQTIIPPRHRQAHTRGLNDFLATGEGPVLNKSVEITALHRDGHEFPAELAVWVVGSGETSTFNAFVRDISERKRAEEERERLHAELEVRAITDSLTSLYNHAHFFQRLAEETERSGRYNHGFAVAMMDVDNFKKFNDSRGHQEGDKILRLVADSIRSGLRRSDLAFRYGGDEFAAIMLHTDAARARTVIDRINRHLARNLKQMNDEAADRVSLSAGVACFGDDGRTADELVRVADAALYSAKWASRARSAAGEEYAIEALAPPPGTSEMGLPSNTVDSLATALRELGVPDALAELNLRTVAALGTLAEIRDPYIRGHQERTSEVAASVAEEMGLSPERVRGTRLAGLLHDLGKAGISKRILNKPGKLTKEEFAEIKEHPPLGSMMIISEIEALQQVVPIVRHHHERFDGTGYPDGLAGQDIPLEARILAVVDAFDAMIHERSYRKALGREHALAELRRGAGSQFDPAVVEAFLAWASKEDEGLPARRQPASEDEEPATVSTTRR